VTKNPKEGLRFARLLMVLGGASPLFILWAIKGIYTVPDEWLWITCGALVLVPNLFLVWRIRTAKKLNEIETKLVGTAEDHRDYLLVYLFAMLLPFYSVDMHVARDLLATIAALFFVIFLFWHLNLHYMNILFAIRGYRIFTVYSPRDDNPISGKKSFVVITRRIDLAPGEKLTLYRLSDTVFFEGDQ
jgi:hypothetical protein